MPDVTEPDWVIHRDGSAHEVLTKEGTWGVIADAKWFATHEDALAAALPEGTTGTPRQQHPDAHDGTPDD
jgi:hypothetical protein